MATKKKAKAKSKSKPKKKKSVARRPAMKKKAAAKKVVKKKAAKKKPAARKKMVARKTAPKTAVKPAPKPAAKPMTPAAITALPGETRVGVVTHYYSHLSVAVVKLESGMLREGDMIHVKGHTSDFRQRVSSMEVDHVHVPEVRAGQSAGFKVSDHAREHDVVFKVGA